MENNTEENNFITKLISNCTDKCIKSKSVLMGSVQFLCVIIILFVGCAPNNPDDIKALTDGNELPSISFLEFEGIATDSGKLKYKLISPEIMQFDFINAESYIEFPKGLHYFVYDSNGEIESQIKCNYAIYFRLQELWELKNDVEIINIEGNVVNSEHLFWDIQEKLIYSDEFVKITTKDDVITGYGFETDEDIKTYTIRQPSGEFAFQE